MDEQLASAFGRGLPFLYVTPAPSAAAFASLDLLQLAWLYRAILLPDGEETPTTRTFRVGAQSRVYIVALQNRVFEVT